MIDNALTEFGSGTESGNAKLHLRMARNRERSVLKFASVWHGYPERSVCVRSYSDHSEIVRAPSDHRLIETAGSIH